ncbi:predicted protein [Uncinocarpus reesii 1704]|uniref:Spindle pole body component n=1 Tax=Uncinocarpus reesii (strain UAMH 1704) TaxID=336963 RepID=C4JLD1_UNCRE|nr:uncharacterized protein UREG_03639 [Uncinocarpus reesii 1704]EEP78793.1 predicted protein [Uncinocarpus reesii 1704]
MDFRPIDNPFAIETLGEPSFFKLQSLEPLERFPWDDSLPDLAHGNFENQSHVFLKDESNIYALNVFGNDFSDSVDSLPDSSLSSCSDEKQSFDSDRWSEIEDIWELKSISEPFRDEALLKSWDTFPNHRRSHQISGPAYLSEAGSAGFDAALAFQSSQSGLEDSGRVVRTDIFMLALFKLSIGWNSIFFRFNEQTRKFEKSMKDVRISGISLPSLDTFINEVLESGSQTRQIRRFLSSMPTRAEAPAALANLSRAVYVSLYSLESQLFERFKSKPSLLESQTLLRRSHCMVKCLADIIETVGVATTEAEVISSIFAKCDHLSQEFLWLTDILHEILSATAGSWLLRIATSIGLHNNNIEPVKPSGSHQLHGIKGGTELLQGFETELGIICPTMPSIVSSEHSDAILESTKSLHFLRRFHPDHPLAQPLRPEKPPRPPLECGFTWNDMDRIQKKAKDYEEGMRLEILKYSRKIQGVADLGQVGTSLTTEGEKETEQRDSDEPIRNVFELSDLDPDANRTPVLEHRDSLFSHKLHQLISKSPCVNIEESLGVDLPFGPPLMSTLYISFASPISSQARLINFSCLHLLFKKHKLKEHLHLQWRFQLLGDGAFLSKLSTTLFDSNVQSSERKAGVARGGTSTGLRLDSRDTWPPASSELRLVLMGLLAECHAEYAKPGCSTQLGTQSPAKELPGKLSFSIRELSDEELIKCKNPNSVQALDFLRLQYTPPPMLESVITSRSLSKYDRIFKHLLRLLRLLSATRGLVRKLCSLPCEQKFAFEALHFVEAIGEYCFHVCVGGLWHKFERTLSRIEKCIDEGDIDGTIEHAKSLSRLREHHEDVLDQMLFAMLLSKKHANANALLEEIFGTVLTLFLQSKSRHRERSPIFYERSIRELHLVFRKQVRGFISFLSSLGNVKSTFKKARHHDLAEWGTGQEAKVDIDSVFDKLLLKLDMTGFYRT